MVWELFGGLGGGLREEEEEEEPTDRHTDTLMIRRGEERRVGEVDFWWFGRGGGLGRCFGEGGG